ncbi:hypothetical protein JNB88_00830 [Rhizobium cauense]|uniref:hypothetical protein n=1 Tax=Rhizobium cauense TaxID=1166683 RepID=UPI001C6E5F99|nr:hypothetical protein [Rhizobium cauense]MBW9112190.1 hypothetical protein [Rhizobium cauense]
MSGYARRELVAGIGMPVAKPSARWWQTLPAALAISLAFAVPLSLSMTPPLIDLPTHVARYHVELNIDSSAALQHYFSFAWRFIPNLGLDILIIPLAALVGLQAGVALLVALIPVATVFGLMWIAREAHDTPPPTALFALPLALSYPLVFGFVNSCLATALALVAFGWWLRLSRQGRYRLRALAFAIIAPAILTAHIIGYGTFGLLAFGSILGQRRAEGVSNARAAREAVVACLPIAWPLVLLLLWQTSSGATTTGWMNWQLKAMWLIMILRDRVQWIDVASVLVLYGVATLPVWRRRSFTIAPALGVPALLLWCAALGLPTRMMGSEFASVRLIPFALAITILAVRPRQEPAAWIAPIALCFIALRLGLTIASAAAADAQIKHELLALDHVKPGSTVAAFRLLRCEREWAPPRLRHLASYATTRRDALVNDQFAEVESQLLAIRPSGNPFGGRALPIPGVFEHECDRWELPTLSASLAALPHSGLDYLWLADVPANLRPTDRRFTPVWQDGKTILYYVSNVAAASDTNPVPARNQTDNN